MRKQWIAMVAAVALSAAANAQEAAELFVNMPEVHLAELDADARRELVKLYDPKSKEEVKAKVPNALRGEARITLLTPDYISLYTSPRSRMELRRLPLVNHTYVICLITTVEGPAMDSRVEFFTTDWQPLVASELYRPARMEDFLREGVDTTEADYGDIKAAADMELFRYELSAEKPVLTVTYTTPDYFNEAMRKKAERYFDKAAMPRLYKWNNGRFDFLK